MSLSWLGLVQGSVVGLDNMTHSKTGASILSTSVNKCFILQGEKIYDL